MASEKDFRDWVRGRWPGWVDGREPRGRSRSGWGSGNGAPDLTLGVPYHPQRTDAPGKVMLPHIRPVIPLPCELKLARITHGTKLVSESEINVDQRKWHAIAHARGVTTAFLWGIPGAVTPGGVYSSWRTFIMKPNIGWCELSEATELPAGEMEFFRGVGDWARARWAQ